MRAAIAILACALTLIATGATAGAIHVLRTGGESAPIVGRAWAVKLTVRPTTFRGVLQMTATGQGRVDARAVRGAGGTYRARLVFPRTGRWMLTARAGGSRSSLGSVTVRPAPPLTFDEPTGIDVAPDGSLLVVEFGLHRLVRVDPATGRVTKVATFGKPWGLARAASGAVFAGDAGSLMRIDPGGTPTAVAAVDPGVEIGPIAAAPAGDVFFATALAIYRLPGGTAGTPQPVAASTTLDSPHGLAVEPAGTLLLSDTNDGRILRIDSVKGTVTTFATIAHPRGIDVAADGTVYVAAADEHRIVRFDSSGQRLGVFGPALGDPYAIALAGDGTLYAVEPGATGFIRRIARDGASSVVTARRSA
jgi:sugar lactone lactonase YvrE